jgi:hypothetical protein
MVFRGNASFLLKAGRRCTPLAGVRKFMIPAVLVNVRQLAIESVCLCECSLRFGASVTEVSKLVYLHKRTSALLWSSREEALSEGLVVVHPHVDDRRLAPATTLTSQI